VLGEEVCGGPAEEEGGMVDARDGWDKVTCGVCDG